jgi:SAM-dependent methyltransferase
MSDPQFWEERYLLEPPETLPWNAGRPDPDLVRLVNEGRIPVGQALDLGTGPGHDAVFLIQKGFDVVGIDISPSAIKLARENASHHGLFGFFQTGDIRAVPMEDQYVDFINDRGCFHTLDPEDRDAAIAEMARVLKRRGLLLLRVFSDEEPGTDGPHRFSRAALESLFAGRFRLLEFWDGVYEGSRRAKSRLVLMEKR